MYNAVAIILVLVLTSWSEIISARYIEADPLGIVPVPGTPMAPLPNRPTPPPLTTPRPITAADVLRFHQLNHSYNYVGSNPLSNSDPYGLQQFPIPSTGISGVQQVGALALPCALNPAACGLPVIVCTCPITVNPGNVIVGTMAAGAGVGAATGVAIGIAHTPHAIAASSGAIGAAGAAAGAFDMMVVGGVTLGAVGVIAGATIVGGIVVMNNTSPNACPPAQCPRCP